MSKLVLSLSAVCALAVLTIATIGCQDAKVANNNSDSPVLMKAEPSGAQQIIAARAGAKNEDTIVVVGRIGGDANPWVENRAAFTLVDNSLKACSDIPGDECEKPWDYCCETDKLPTASLLVKVVDSDGKLIATDARKLLGVKELQTVVVQGKAKRDDKGNLTVLATGVFVKS